MVGFSQLIAALHRSKREMGVKKLQCNPGLVPEFVAASPIFTTEIGMGILISEVPFDPGSPSHQVAPEHLVSDRIMGRIDSVGKGSLPVRADLIRTDHPAMV
jgi:hypothetical protein